MPILFSMRRAWRFLFGPRLPHIRQRGYYYHAPVEHRHDGRVTHVTWDTFQDGGDE
jgi:hypothetical protein